MKFIGNVLWLIFGGLGIALEYLISSLILMLTIIGIPFGMQTLKLAIFALWPFGREVVPNRNASGFLTVLMNIIWFLIGGFWIALSHLVVGLLLAITIIGLPFANRHFKMIPLALFPFGKDVI